MKGLGTFAFVVALSSPFAGTAAVALADDTIKQPGDHPMYRIEAEPHLLWGWEHYGSYAATDGIGVGGRLSFPLVDNGFVPTINNSVAISVGLDWLHYSGPSQCVRVSGVLCVGGGENADYVFIPVAMQWNFYIAKSWSVFGEPGLVVYHGFFSNPCNGIVGCSIPNFPSTTGVDFAAYLGGRYHFTPHVALTMRIGYPTFSVGVSFM